MIIVGVWAIVFSAFAKAVMDTSSEGVLDWKPSDYWIKDLSWGRKWKDVSKKIEAFPGSSTIFVFLTDGWHLSQFFAFNLFAVGIFLMPTVWWCLGAMVAHKILFQLFYSFLKEN